jgi:transcriptional regulator with XRE-family HTH domain
MNKTLVEKYVENIDNMRLFQQERSIYEVTEMLESLMEQQGINRAELAKRLGRTKGWVTQLLDGEANKTIRTVADVCAVLGQEFCSFHRPIRIGREAKPVASADQSSDAKGEPSEAKPIIKLYQASAFSPVPKSSSAANSDSADAVVTL